MQPSLSERLTAQFYEWEQRGRGWLYHPQLSVDLEPPFYPFFHHVPRQAQHIDDGKRHTLVSWALHKTKRLLFPEPQEQEGEAYQEPAIPYLFDCDEAIKVFSVSYPKGHKVGIEETEQLLLMLSYCHYPLSFEIVGSSIAISLQLVCRVSDASQLLGQIKAFFPDCIITEKADQIEAIVTKSGSFASISHFGLKDEFMLPLRMADTFNPDPLTGIFGALEHLEDGEHAVIQILFQGAQNPWAESIMRSVTDSDGKSFFANAPEMVKLAQEKVTSPLFGVAMRVMGVGKTVDDAHRISQSVGSAFGRLYFSPSNSLIQIYPDIDFQTNVDDMLLRESHLTGMLLNGKELATIVHLPSDTVASQKLQRISRKTKHAPSIAKGHSLVLGVNEHQGKEEKVSVSSEQRLKHTHIIGATGTGKSTLLLSMISQDIQSGNGLAVLDPHGDLIDSILSSIPENSIQDVILIDPSDTEYSVAFNILSANSEVEKEILSSDLVASFKRLSTSWGDQMNSVLANAILAFLESPQGGTLADLRRFLIEKPYRDTFLKTVTDPNVVYYWQKEYPLLKTNSIGSILTRLDTFLRPKPIRYMVAQKETLDFEYILDTKKILLIKLSQGLIGNENSYLLGTFFVTKMYQAAMARQAKGKEQRSDFFLYIDEFQNFITPSMSLILSGARKYHLGLILAHQDMQQLVKYDSELASAVVSNAGTRICFRLGDTDAKRFASGFSFFEAQDLENLNTGEAIARIERPDYDFSLSTVPLPEPDAVIAKNTKQAVTDYCRGRYGTARTEIESLLHENTIAQEQPEIQRTPLQPKAPPSQPEIPTISEEAIEETMKKLVQQKEETEHRYLQNLIKKMAESRGYKATVEAPVPGGNGRVDVLLERNGKQIACEVCVTTDVEWEVHNIQKCLEAGYGLIVECSNDKKILENLKKKITATFDISVQERILIYTPEDFFAWLDEQIVKEASTETRIKGYRVKVEYTAPSEAEMQHKKAAISKAVLGSARKRNT